MAIYESRLYGEFFDILHTIENEILNGSISASCEESSNYEDGDVRLSVRVFERYSFIGSNRLSLSLTLLQNKDSIFLTAITSGGSQALFFKVNSFGEEAFLEKILPIIEQFSSPK